MKLSIIMIKNILIILIFLQTSYSSIDEQKCKEETFCYKNEVMNQNSWTDLDYRSFMQKDLIDKEFSAINVTKSIRLKPNR